MDFVYNNNRVNDINILYVIFVFFENKVHLFRTILFICSKNLFVINNFIYYFYLFVYLFRFAICFSSICLIIFCLIKYYYLLCIRLFSERLIFFCVCILQCFLKKFSRLINLIFNFEWNKKVLWIFAYYFYYSDTFF